jgi:hypothetical protein
MYDQMAFGCDARRHTVPAQLDARKGSTVRFRQRSMDVRQGRARFTLSARPLVT